jgi:hypothetical protein
MVDHDASLATVSPRNIAAMIVRRKPDAKSSIVRVKFQGPAVARPTRSRSPSPNPRDSGPSLTAATTIRGRATARAKATMVRRRRNCRMSSTRTVRVWRAT